jgi:copper homeostasis protein
MARVQLEICCGSLEDAVEAEAGGADRVELCSALFLGGLTPSFGALVEAKARLAIPVIFMARPRGGGFCYTAVEMAAMERDAEMAVAQGADGVVFGILEADGRIDLARSGSRISSGAARRCSTARSTSRRIPSARWTNWWTSASRAS